MNTAVCVGVNDYPGTDSDLRGCVNDATNWAQVFRASGFTVKLLLNSDATGKNMRDAIRLAVGAARSGEMVVFQFSGHGSFVPDKDGDEPDGADECLCPHDILTNGPIVDDEIAGLFRTRKQVKRLIIADSCHSGTVARFAPAIELRSIGGAVVASLFPSSLVKFLPPSVFCSWARKVGYRFRASSSPGRQGVLLMAGCQDAEYSYDALFNGRPSGAFTYFALQELARKPATFQKWYDGVRKLLPSRQYPQTPNLYGTSDMMRWPVPFVGAN